ncbi:MAG: glutaredoxin domain-containing protein [Burkholderiaceae bacterium]
MNANFSCLALAAMLTAALPALAQYRWTDPEGRVNYGDAPPAEAKNLSRMDGRTRSEAGDPTGGIPFELRKAMTSLPITLYTALDCGPCESARAWLRRRGAPYQEIVVDTEVDAEEFKRRVGTTSVPVMTLGRTPHTGFNEGTWSAALSAAGYPAQIVLPPTYRPEPPKPILPRDTPERAPGNSPAPKS